MLDIVFKVPPRYLTLSFTYKFYRYILSVSVSLRFFYYVNIISKVLSRLVDDLSLLYH